MENNNKRFVYADNAATTQVSEPVLNAMMPFFKDCYGNPSSLHQAGRAVSLGLNEAREKIASLLGAKANEIYFTASGSEADNWAIRGAAHARAGKGRHLITSSIEHHAVLHTMKALEKEGFEVTYLPVNELGTVRPETLENAIRGDTTLVAIMFANNEIGTIEPIKELCEIAHRHNALFFTDAVQAVGAVPVNAAELGVDMLSLSGHKIHAPKGIGCLYIKNGVRITNLIEGGGQERGKRGGTENVAYIAGLAQALEDAVNALPDMARVAAMRDRLMEGIMKIPYAFINGSRESRLPGNVNACFECIEGESLLLRLDIMGICASTGSACSSASLEPSHVLLAIGVPTENAHGSLRLSISHETTDEDVDYILEKLPAVVKALRDMSPLWERKIKSN